MSQLATVDQLKTATKRNATLTTAVYNTIGNNIAKDAAVEAEFKRDIWDKVESDIAVIDATLGVVRGGE